jgi:hypothetical protein
MRVGCATPVRSPVAVAKSRHSQGDGSQDSGPNWELTETVVGRKDGRHSDRRENDEASQSDHAGRD